jgi:hypothetical protein
LTDSNKKNIVRSRGPGFYIEADTTPATPSKVTHYDKYGERIDPDESIIIAARKKMEQEMKAYAPIANHLQLYDKYLMHRRQVGQPIFDMLETLKKIEEAERTSPELKEAGKKKRQEILEESRRVKKDNDKERRDVENAMWPVFI